MTYQTEILDEVDFSTQLPDIASYCKGIPDNSKYSFSQCYSMDGDTYYITFEDLNDDSNLNITYVKSDLSLNTYSVDED